jgi:DNA-binding beta-propeller fold protein YncE
MVASVTTLSFQCRRHCVRRLGRQAPAACASGPAIRLWSPTFPIASCRRRSALDSTGRLFIGANRVNHNQREAEVYTVDLKTGELQLVAAVGGAQLDTLLVTPDNRVFFTDPAHDAVHEVVLGSRFLDNELRLIRNGNLVSGGRHPGAASGTARKYGHAAFRTEMLTGQEDLATAGGAAAWTTPDGTDLVLLADTYQLKSLTADRFVDSWPLPLAADGAPTRFVGARNVYVAPPRAAPAHEPHAVLVSDWARSTVHLLSPFAPHEGDFDVDATIVSRLVAPYGVALTADGTVLVADFVTGEVTAHAVGAAAPVVIASGLDGPVGLALAPADENGTAVFVTEYKAGRVARIERATGERTVVASGLTRPEGIAVSPLDGRLTVIESGGEHRLLSIDAKPRATCAWWRLSCQVLATRPTAIRARSPPSRGRRRACSTPTSSLARAPPRRSTSRSPARCAATRRCCAPTTTRTTSRPTRRSSTCRCRRATTPAAAS